MSEDIKRYRQLIESSELPEDEDTHFGMPNDIYEEYSYGKCMILSLALNDIKGWKIEAVLNPDYGHIDHSWVVDDHGRAIDIIGPQKRENIAAEYGHQVSDIQQYSREEFVELINQTGNGKPITDNEISEARKVALKYVLPKI